MNKKISRYGDPDDKLFGFAALGSRDIELPSDAIVSITLFEKLGILRFIVNSILGNLVMLQMKKNEGLLYAEVGGSLRDFSGVTLSVWNRTDMVPFRDSGTHKVAMKHFRWVFGGRAQTYFLTFPARGRIPTFKESITLAKQHGRHFDGNRLVRQSTRPDWNELDGEPRSQV